MHRSFTHPGGRLLSQRGAWWSSGLSPWQQQSSADWSWLLLTYLIEENTAMCDYLFQLMFLNAWTNVSVCKWEWCVRIFMDAQQSNVVPSLCLSLFLGLVTNAALTSRNHKRDILPPFVFKWLLQNAWTRSASAPRRGRQPDYKESKQLFSCLNEFSLKTAGSIAQQSYG